MIRKLTKTIITLSFFVSISIARGQCIELTDSPPITVTADNTIVENLLINATDSDGITVNNASNVIIRNCKINFTTTHYGILFVNSPNITIENCEIICTDAPERGPLFTADPNPPGGEMASDSDCIAGRNSNDATITNVRLEDGSAGIRLLFSDNATMTFIEGHNFRGPFPRGQLLQWGRCIGGSIENFSVINDRAIAWTEDNISIFQSGGQEIKKGYIFGNNSPSGVGVLFEDQMEDGARGGLGGLVEDVDFVEMGNGAVSSVDGAGNVIFRRVRSRDNICGDLGQGRGTPSSNALTFSGFGTEPGAGGNRIEESAVFNLCNPNSQIVFPRDRFEVIDFTEDVDFTPRAPITADLQFCTLSVATFESVGATMYVDLAADELRVAMDLPSSGSNLRVFSLSGREIKRQEFKSSELIRISLSGLAQSIYLVRMDLGTKQVVAKFLRP